MAKLKKLQLENLNNILIKNDLIDILQKHLKNNQINDIEIESIKFKPKDPQLETSNSNKCENGKKRVLVCTLNGKCTYICQ
jgi:hypothetical protein